MNNITDPSQLNVESGVCAIKFSATWCAPCKRMEPIVKKLSEEFSDVNFYEIDVDEVATIAQDYKVRSLPTLVITKDGKEVDRVIGSSLIEPLRKVFRDLTGTSFVEAETV